MAALTSIHLHLQKTQTPRPWRWKCYNPLEN